MSITTASLVFSCSCTDYILMIMTDLIKYDLGDEIKDLEEPLPTDFEYLGPLSEGDNFPAKNSRSKFERHHEIVHFSLIILFPPIFRFEFRKS